MSGSPQDGNHSIGARPSRSLREELSSLRIERTAPAHHDQPPRHQDRTLPRAESYRPARAAKARGGGRKVLSALLWLIPLALLGGLAKVGWDHAQQLRPRPMVTLEVVREMSSPVAEQLMTAKGYLKSHNQALVGAKVPGRILRLLVEEGMKVKKGDLLAVLEHPELDAALESRKAEVQRAEAALKEAGSDFANKDLKAKRTEYLIRKNFASAEARDQANSDSAMASARIAAMQADLMLARSQVVEAQTAIDNMEIHAPFDGTILKKEAEAGETISTMSMGGSNTRSAIANLADLEHMEVEADVSEGLLSVLTIGQPADVEVSAFPDRRYRGRVQRIIPMGDRSRGTVKVMIEILDTDGRLFPELVANVHILPVAGEEATEAAESALYVSQDAIVQDGGRSYAWVLDPSQAVHKRPVEVTDGRNNLARIEKGLKADEKVVLKPSKDLREGELVREEQ